MQFSLNANICVHLKWMLVQLESESPQESVLVWPHLEKPAMPVAAGPSTCKFVDVKLAAASHAKR